MQRRRAAIRGARAQRSRGQASFKAHRLHGLGLFCQGVGQVQGQSLQGAGHQQFRYPTAQRHQQRVGRAAAGPARQLRQHPQLWRLRQRLRRSHAPGAQLQCAFGRRGLRCQALHSAFQQHLPPKRACACILQGKTRLGEFHRAAGTRQGGRVRGHAHAVAGQRDAAAHLRLVQVAEGQLQLQLQCRRPAGDGLVQRMAGPGRQRGRLHHAQQLAQGPACFGVHRHHCMGQVGNVRLHLAELHCARPLQRSPGTLHAHRRALEHQFARQVFQGRPGRLALHLQAWGNVAIGHVPDLRRNAKGALARIGERQVVQVALHLEIHPRGLARQHGVAHVMARLGRNDQRQVAVYARAVGPHQLAAQVQHPRKARAARRAVSIAGVPGGAQRAFGIAVGKLRLAHLHGHLLALQLPAHGTAQALQRQPGVFKNARQQQRAAVNGHRRLAPCLRHFQLDGGAPQARAGHLQRAIARPGRAWQGCRHGAQLQPCHPGTRLVAPQCLGRPLPGSLQALHQPLGCVALQGLVQLVAQRQALRNACQRRQVHVVGVQFALRLPGAARAVAVLQPHIAAGPAQAVVGHKGQGLRVKLEPAGQRAPAQAPLHAGQHQRLQPLAQRGLHVRQCHVGRAAHGAAALDVQPRAHRAPAAGDGFAQVCVQPQALHIDAVKVGKGLAAPLLPVAAAGGQQRLAKLAHQRKALAPLGRWRGLHLQAVAPVAVAQQHIDLVQRQRRGLAQAVVPAHRAAPHHHLGLGKQPVGSARVAGGAVGKQQPGHKDAAVCGAADVQLGAFDVQLLKPQAPQRARRHGQHHALQVQRGAALGVEQRHAAQFDGRHQAVALRRQGADAHRHPQGATGLRLQQHPVVADTRHNPAVQRPPGRCQQHHHRQQQTQGPARQPRHGLERA